MLVTPFKEPHYLFYLNWQGHEALGELFTLWPTFACSENVNFMFTVFSFYCHSIILYRKKQVFICNILNFNFVKEIENMKTTSNKCIESKYTIIYVRVSTDDQARHGHSIDYQIEVCLRKAKELNLDNIIQYVDDGYSGTSLKRPEMKKIIQHIERNEIANLIIYDLDRLSRNISDSIALTELTRKHKVDLVGVNFDSSLTTADQRFLFHIKTALSQLESEKISERTINGLKGGMSKGKYTISKVPYGYVRGEDTLMPVPEELKHIERIFEMYTVDMFSTDLISKQISSITDKKFSSSTICKILKNQRYTGSFTYRGETYDNLGFIPSITEEMYDIAKERLNSNFKKMKHNYLFYKKLVCNSCGKILSNKSTRKKNDVYLYYMCETIECISYQKRINQNIVYDMLHDRLVRLYNKHTFPFYDTSKSAVRRIYNLNEISNSELKGSIVKYLNKTSINLK